MNKRTSHWSWFALWIFAGLIALLCGWLMPVHLRAVDIALLENAGRILPTVVAQNVGGSSTATARLFGLGDEPLTPFVIHRENRQRILSWLESSPLPVVQELLRCRALTNTVLLPPSSSSSGQAFDAAISICGLLLNSGHLAEGLSDQVFASARAANHGEGSRPIEAILMDELSLGERFDWRQLVIFNGHIQDPQTLALLADSARSAGNRLPVLFSAVEMSREPGRVAQYLANYTVTGLADLETSEHYGARAVDELLRHNQRIYASPLRQRVAGIGLFGTFVQATAEYAVTNPMLVMVLKWFFFLIGGLFIAFAVQSARRATDTAVAQQRPASLLARELLFASGVLLVALLVSEPYLALGSQKGEAPFRLRLSAVGGAIPSQFARAKQSTMNTPNMTASLLTLLLFFILQALIYMACLSRLNETLRQNVSARIKLKLLENEDHLFDAGLYLGFVGTIICLILVSLGVLQFSLMAAYSSTSFGIIFVSVLKIFKVRPVRRRLLLEAEADNAATEVSSQAATQTYATAS